MEAEDGRETGREAFGSRFRGLLQVYVPNGPAYQLIPKTYFAVSSLTEAGPP